MIPGYDIAEIRIGAVFKQGKYDLSVWGENALDTKYYQNLSTSSIVGASLFAFAGQLGTLRTYGVTLRVVL